MLNNSEIKQFDRDGFISLISALTHTEAGELRQKLEIIKAVQNGALSSTQRNKSFLLFKWLNDLTHDTRILEPVSQLTSPDILLWNTLFWIKEAGAKKFVSWHQDTKYWGLSSESVVTAWITLSATSINAGCMRVMPGTKNNVLSHKDCYHDENMLTRGQEISSSLDESKAVFMPLEVGQMSIHNYRLAHASGPNTSDDRRIGISMHFMPPEIKQVAGRWDCAMLVQGNDAFGNFEKTPIPDYDFDACAVAFYEIASKATNEVLYTRATVNDGKL